MSKAPLRLKNYFCTEVSLKANPNFKYEDFKEENIDFSVKSNVRVGTLKQNPLDFQVMLDVKIEPIDERPLPYDVSLALVGFFEVDPDYSATPPADLVRVTGSSILYSAAREFLLSLMGRGPWEPLMLPATSFLHFADKKKDKQDAVGKP